MKNKKLLCSVCFLFAFMSVLWGQNITVKGNVTSKTDGQPVIGASVVEATATANGTITDLDGNFTLSVPANSTLKITYIGYKPVTVKSAAIVNVLLEEDTQMVDEVVVTGYTTQRKADLTGAVSVVKVDEIQKQGENNPVKALQGRVPGMNITADGNPSGSATVRIRGIGTLNNNDPLYIIDGVPTKAGMHELNGNDIESIQVLKDAASCALYGSRASNGVILITTKKAKKQGVSLQLDIRHGFSARGQGDYERMNANQFMETMWQGYRNQLISNGSSPEEATIATNNDIISKVGINIYNKADNALFDANGHLASDARILDGYKDDLDWYSPYTRNGHRQEYNLSGESGNEKNRIRFSLGHLKQICLSRKSMISG